MEQITAPNDCEELSPFLLIPKEWCTALETSCYTEENNYVGLSENGISFKDHNLQFGETSQHILVNDPMFECLFNGEVDNEVTIDYNESETVIITPTPEDHDLQSERDTDCENVTVPQYDQVSEADSVIAKVMSNQIFLLHAKKVTKIHRIQHKACNVCLKKIGRISELKRHLIKHIVKSTLSKTPVNHDGTLAIDCEVCHNETFFKINQYRAHLREHAHLTNYKCTFCDKTFSDCSNFSKHRKTHSSTFFQCDMCQRKFNSKKTLIQHIEYHNNSSPMQCNYCDKIFHFESMLFRHIRYNHKSKYYKCQFCDSYFLRMKGKWEHEWSVHNARKMIYDCMNCGAKFRKYAELKRHCIAKHEVQIPLAKNLLKIKE